MYFWVLLGTSGTSIASHLLTFVSLFSYDTMQIEALGWWQWLPSYYVWICCQFWLIFQVWFPFQCENDSQFCDRIDPVWLRLANLLWFHLPWFAALSMVRKPIRHPFKLGLVCPHLVRFGLIWSTVEGGDDSQLRLLAPPMTGHSNSRSENPFLIVL